MQEQLNSLESILQNDKLESEKVIESDKLSSDSNLTNLNESNLTDLNDNLKQSESSHTNESDDELYFKAISNVQVRERIIVDYLTKLNNKVAPTIRYGATPTPQKSTPSLKQAGDLTRQYFLGRYNN